MPRNPDSSPFRPVVRSLRGAVLLPLLLSAAPVPAPPKGPDRPLNIVVLLVDDLGWADVSPNNGETFYETPNVERLAASGMRFTDAYAACPVCSPTRASLLTGKYPARLGLTTWLGAPQPEQAKGRDTVLLPAPYVDRLVLEEVTLAEALKDAGYVTYFAGKWHLGGVGFFPEDQGFDEYYGGHRAGHPYKGYFSPYQFPNLEEGPEGEYLTDRLTDESVRFLERMGKLEGDARKPFLLYLSYYTVHTPLQGRPDLVERFKEKKAGLAIDGEIFGKEGERKVRQVQEHAVYAAMVHSMDMGVGRILDALDANGFAEDTAVIFFSDNGGLSTSEGHPTSNLPLRAGKGWLYEGGVREPCLVRWPGHTKPGAVSSVPVLSTDFYPTILEMAGLPPRPEQHVDGVSLAPVLTGEGELEPRTLFWHYPHYSNQGGRPSSALRKGKWKLIEHFEDGRRELFDLATDVGEQTNLAAQHEDVVTELARELNAWRGEVGALYPTPHPGVEKKK